MFKKLINTAKQPYVFSIIAEVVGILAAFLFTVFQARFLGTEIKGQIATINSMLTITSIIFGLGLRQSYPYYKKNSKEDVLSIFLKLTGLLFLIYLMIGVVLSVVFRLDIKYAAVLCITPLVIFNMTVSDITLVEIPNKRNATNMVVSLFELLFVVILWQTTRPTVYLGIATIAFTHIVKSIYLTWFWRKRFFSPTRLTWPWVLKLIQFGIFPMLAILMSNLNYRVDILMLNGQVPDSAIGIYSIGVLLADRMWMIPDALKGVMVSNITKGKGSDEVNFVIRVSNTLCAIIFLLVVLFGEPFVTFVFGNAYAGAYNVALIVLFGVFPMISHKVIVAYNTVIGKQRVSLLFLSISVVMNVVINSFLIPRYGIFGAGYASVISYWVCSILFIAYFCKTTGSKVTSLLLVNKKDISRFVRFIRRSE